MIRWRIGVRLAWAAALPALTGMVFGQTPYEDHDAAQRARVSAETRAARIAAIEQDRPGFVSSLLAPWRDGFADGGEEMERYLLGAPIERLIAAASARDLLAFRSAATGRNLARPNAPGDTDSDLVFFPVPPCRIFDTRSSVNGILVAGVTQSFLVNGDLSDQGGSASGCGIPVDPSAVVFNLAAVTPSGSGNIRAWRFGDPVPFAAALNFNTGNTNPALSNMITVPACDLCGPDISLRAEVSNVHAVADVVGYYDVPVALPMTAQATFDITVPVPTVSTEILVLDFTCPADGFVIAMGHVVAIVNHVNGTTDNVHVKLTDAEDSSFFGPGWTQALVDASYPSSINRVPLHLSARFACTGGVTVRYRINAQTITGEASTDSVGWGTLILQYSPF